MIRPAVPADYDAIARVVDDWWGRPVVASIPRLFLDHFARTSLVAEESGALVGFLIGFFAPGGLASRELAPGELVPDEPVLRKPAPDGPVHGELACGEPVPDEPPPDESAVAYIHFVGVHPDYRGSGLARGLYERFAAAARADGRMVIRAITSPANSRSIAFHRALGFTVSGPIPDYNGPGRDMVTFEWRAAR